MSAAPAEAPAAAAPAADATPVLPAPGTQAQAPLTKDPIPGIPVGDPLVPAKEGESVLGYRATPSQSTQRPVFGTVVETAAAAAMPAPAADAKEEPKEETQVDQIKKAASKYLKSPGFLRKMKTEAKKMFRKMKGSMKSDTPSIPDESPVVEMPAVEAGGVAPAP